MTTRDDFFLNVVSRDFRDLFSGKQIGFGQFREVFVSKQDPDAVLKFELNDYSFHNIMEHFVWQEVQGTPHAKWFAPVLDISANGAVLIQRRTKRIEEDDLPAKMPCFFTDLKMSNFGRLGKRVVCHDYGFTLLMANGLTKRMAKADWWNTDGTS